MIMIEKHKKPITYVEDNILTVTLEEIELYLDEIKEAVRRDRYRIDRNSRRQGNRDLFLDYIIDETKAKDILLSLEATDFSEKRRNEHKGYEHEILYIFGKNIKLLKRFEPVEKVVSLYIKFNKLENCFVIVISFHEQKYPMKYYFK